MIRIVAACSPVKRGPSYACMYIALPSSRDRSFGCQGWFLVAESLKICSHGIIYACVLPPGCLHMVHAGF